jgi:hypothetical protein
MMIVDQLAASSCKPHLLEDPEHHNLSYTSHLSNNNATNTASQIEQLMR